MIDEFGERNNLPPEKIPWEAIKCFLTQNLYGGKIDNNYDLKVLDSLVEEVFTKESFDTGFKLFKATNEGEQSLVIPEAMRT